MPSPATVDIGGNSYPSYNSIEDSDAYIAASPTAASIWAALESDTKGQHSVAAARVLNALSWPGQLAEDDQELAWPRINTGISGVLDDEIPQPLCEAHNELIILSASGTDIANFTSTATVEKRIKAGSVEVENFASFGQSIYPFPLSVWRLISRYLGSATTAIGGVFTSGTDGCSITNHNYTHSVGF